MDFIPEYLSLLRRQVEEEIAYLSAHGHSQKSKLSTEPCVFCVDNTCTRMAELKQFLSQILVKMNMKPIDLQPKSLMLLVNSES